MHTFTVELSSVDKWKRLVSVAISYSDPDRASPPPSKIIELFLYTKFLDQRRALLGSWYGNSSVHTHLWRDDTKIAAPLRLLLFSMKDMLVWEIKRFTAIKQLYRLKTTFRSYKFGVDWQKPKLKKWKERKYQLKEWLEGLRIERSGFEPWPGTLRCVLGQDTSISQCLSTLKLQPDGPLGSYVDLTCTFYLGEWDEGE